MSFPENRPRIILPKNESHENVSESGVLVVIAGPTAAGKSKVQEGLVDLNPGMHRVITYTTRDRRPHEVEDIDYHYVDTNIFKAGLEAGEFLESDEYNGKLYGTKRRDILPLIEEGRDVTWILTMGRALTINNYIQHAFDEVTARRIIDQKVTMLVTTETKDQLAEQFIKTRGGTREEFEHRIKSDWEFVTANQPRFGENVIYNIDGQLNETIGIAQKLVQQKRQALRQNRAS